MVVLGRHQKVTARPSSIVAGETRAGKTTTLLHVGRACHPIHSRRRGDAAGQASVTDALVPPAPRSRTLPLELARYLDAPATTFNPTGPDGTSIPASPSASHTPPSAGGRSSHTCTDKAGA
ncbi:hypothetical protein OHB53_47080 [Streptomyces sp. NBC_00056]|uniref:hypothetical protein n=1 Tax=Streptomyces sp. NBC_00056 TaxID=2975633 RepID=UPI003251EAB3